MFCSLQVPIHDIGFDVIAGVEELQQLRETVLALTAQCAQLDEANRAWQQYQQAQLDIFRTKLLDYVPMDENTPFDQMAQEIVDSIVKEREEFNERLQTVEQSNNDLLSIESNNLESIRESYTNTVNELNQELQAMKEAYEQLDGEKQDLVDELEKRDAVIDQEPTKETIGMFSLLNIQL